MEIINKEKVDLDLLPRLELHSAAPLFTHESIQKYQDAFTAHKYRSLCIPSCWMEFFDEKFPDRKLASVINYPCGYHPIEVVYREAVAVSSLVEDMSRIEVNMYCPRKMYREWDLLKELNDIINVKLILVKGIERSLRGGIPQDFKAAEFVQFNTDDHHRLDDDSMVKYSSMFRKQGYKVMIGGIQTREQLHKYDKLIKPDLISTSNTKLIFYNEKEVVYDD